jgi:hypothetical protein
MAVQFGDLGEEGSVEIYSKKAKEVTRNGTKLREGNDFKYDAQLQKLTIPFKGAAKVSLNGAGSLFKP